MTKLGLQNIFGKDRFGEAIYNDAEYDGKELENEGMNNRKMDKNKKVAENRLFNELSQLTEHSRMRAISQVNSTLTLLFWQIGKRINEEVLQNRRADYGKQIVSSLSTQLKNKFGKNFELRNVRRMMQFAEQFPNTEIVATLSRHLYYRNRSQRKFRKI